MKFEQYLNETKWMDKTMLGYKVDSNDLNQITKTIKSFLDKTKIPYIQTMNHHITIAQIIGKYSKDDIIREIHKIPSNFNMKPKKLKLLWGKNVKKWFITIEYNQVDKYKKALEMIENVYPDVVKFPGGMKPHISLFSIDGDDLDPYVWNDIDQRKFFLPTIKLKEVQLFNNKFELEFEYKKI